MKSRGLPSSGNKNELINRLEKALADTDPGQFNCCSDPSMKMRKMAMWKHPDPLSGEQSERIYASFLTNIAKPSLFLSRNDQLG